MFNALGKLFGGGGTDGPEVVEGEAHQLTEGGNDEAVEAFKSGVALRRVNDGALRQFIDYPDSHLIFVTAWDPASLECLENLHKPAKQMKESELVIVFFQEQMDDVQIRNSTWYYRFAHVLESSSWGVAEQIRCAPVIVELDFAGDPKRITFGLI